MSPTKVDMKRVLRAALTLFLLLSACATSQLKHAAEPGAATACVYLTRHDGAHYALAYAGRECTRKGYLALPLEQYDPVARWSSNAEAAGIVSALDIYRIRARLATRDERSEHGPHGIHEPFRRWSEYKWVEHAKYAYLAALDTLGRESAITKSLETSLLGLRFATKRYDRFALKERKLSAAEEADLLVLLATTEVALGDEKRMGAVRWTLDEIVAATSPVYAEGARQVLGKFRLD